MLNSSKGAAVQGPRVQADRKRYRAEIHRLLDAQSGLEIVEGEAVGLLLAGGAVAGLSLADGRRLHAPSVVLATGTRSEEHTSELQSLMRLSYAVFCLKK